MNNMKFLINNDNIIHKEDKENKESAWADFSLSSLNSL
jgi:hypothetical protein